MLWVDCIFSAISPTATHSSLVAKPWFYWCSTSLWPPAQGKQPFYSTAPGNPIVIGQRWQYGLISLSCDWFRHGHVIQFWLVRYREMTLGKYFSCSKRSTGGDGSLLQPGSLRGRSWKLLQPFSKQEGTRLRIKTNTQEETQVLETLLNNLFSQPLSLDYCNVR